MGDACIVCECEPVDPQGWLIQESEEGAILECVCPWCVKDMKKVRDLIKTHDGSDYHARQLFDEIDLLFENTARGKC